MTGVEGMVFATVDVKVETPAHECTSIASVMTGVDVADKETSALAPVYPLLASETTGVEWTPACTEVEYNKTASVATARQKRISNRPKGRSKFSLHHSSSRPPSLDAHDSSPQTFQYHQCSLHEDAGPAGPGAPSQPTGPGPPEPTGPSPPTCDVPDIHLDALPDPEPPPDTRIGNITPHSPESSHVSSTNASTSLLRDLRSGPWSPDKWSAAYAQRRSISRFSPTYSQQDLPLTVNEAVVDDLWANSDCTQALIGFQNIQTLPELQTGEKNFDLSELMRWYNFAHVSVAETGRNWYKLREDDCLPY
eukprot:6697220-Ditylum_brightwellii.AAC.1